MSKDARAIIIQELHAAYGTNGNNNALVNALDEAGLISCLVTSINEAADCDLIRALNFARIQTNKTKY